MGKFLSNRELSELLRKVAAAYQITGANRFQIIAYERAADSIEHLTSEAKDLWDDGKLSDIPGVGTSLAGYLDELFRTGRVRHFDSVMSKVPQSVFPLLNVPGIGPKKAYKLVTTLKLNNPQTAVDDLAKAAKNGRIASIEGFGPKSEEDILSNIALFKAGQVKENRMTLPIADAIATELCDFLKKHPDVERVDVLGSLRRQAATIGDIDLAVATRKPDAVLVHFLRFPHKKIIEQGETGASLLLVNGRQVDLRVQNPATYGSMLQYFTGSKNHNIHLRSFALERGLSLSEYGIKHVRTGKIMRYGSEEAFYEALNMKWIPPELREDMGEIEASLKNRLPHLVTLKDMKGDLHIHTDYNLEPSHDLGASDLEDYLLKAEELGYAYIGISDHNPSISTHTDAQIVSIMKKRKEYYEEKYYSIQQKSKLSVRIIIMLEVDILTDGKLALPDAAFEYVDGVIASVHSAFTQDKRTMTDRVVKALTSHQKVRIFGHPTARLLGQREGIELDWEKIFNVCRSGKIALEVNAYPDRLDLPDHIVFDALRKGLSLVIDTDSHAVDQMDLMKYGISVARRGWATSSDILNTLSYNEFTRWLKGDI